MLMCQTCDGVGERAEDLGEPCYDCEGIGDLPCACGADPATTATGSTLGHGIESCVLPPARRGPLLDRREINWILAGYGVTLPYAHVTIPSAAMLDRLRDLELLLGAEWALCYAQTEIERLRQRLARLEGTQF